jgi:hypothetical protein
MMSWRSDLKIFEYDRHFRKLSREGRQRTDMAQISKVGQNRGGSDEINMTNAPESGDRIVTTTNADGSVSVVTITEVGTTWGFWPTPMGWLAIVLIVAATGLVLIYLFKARNVTK